VTPRDADELAKPVAETGLVGSPQLVVKKHPNRVESDLLGHAKLGVDAVRIVGTRLEHLDLVHSGRGDVVGADQPALSRVPGVGAVGGPSIRRSGGDGQLTQCCGRCQVQRELEGGSPAHHVTIVFVSGLPGLVCHPATQQVRIVIHWADRGQDGWPTYPDHRIAGYLWGPYEAA
jgi:hypothetical protein